MNFKNLPQKRINQRMLALDALRGLTIALMILVNTPGSWAHIYSPLKHADWHGFTLTDIVFPLFLFITGAAMSFSFSKAQSLPKTPQVLKILKRSIIIFMLGLFLNAITFTESFEQLRFMGVLQRIGLAYFITATLLVLFTTTRMLSIAVVILFAYWAILIVFVQADPFALESNIVRELDVWLLGADHLWQGKGLAFDPEGILSTLPAVASTIAGFEITRRLVTFEDKLIGIKWLIKLGMLLVLIGYIWGIFLPINKSLWTSSYVVVSTGYICLLLATLVWLIDLKNYGWLSKPLQVFGLNPLFIYSLSWLLTLALYLIPMNNSSAYEGLYQSLLPILSPINASLLFAFANVCLLWYISSHLYRRNIVIKI